MVVSAIRALALIIVVLAPIGASAQTSPPPAAPSPPPAAVVAAEARAARSARGAHRSLSRSVALRSADRVRPIRSKSYEADRWLTAHKDLQGDKLKAAADKEDWDKSVKSLLIATPDVLRMMGSKLDWTEMLGRRRPCPGAGRHGCHPASTDQG